MKKNVLIKMIIIILICISTLTLLKNNSYANEEEEYSISNIFSDAEKFLQAGQEPDAVISKEALRKTSSFLYKLLFAIGLVVAVIVGIVLGIQFMISSAEEKAKIKEALIAYVISCIVLFGAYGIWTNVINIAQEATSISSGEEEKTDTNKDSEFNSVSGKF